MQNPSLVVVPYRYKATKLYSEIPITGVGDFTVGRLLDTATRVNSNGNIEVVNANIPRLDYYTTGGVAGCPALLVEPSGTNFLLQSEAWNVSPWTATSGSQGATVSGNVTTSPDGTTNADKLIEAAVTGNHFCLQTLTLTSGTTYTASCFVKASERTRGRLRMSGSGAYWDLDFNLTSVTVSGGTNPFIQNFGNGWYRIGATFTANQASNNFILFLLDASGTVSYTGDGTSGLFVFGAQIEVGSVATSYIPTTTGSVTRNADVINVSGAVSGLIGQSEGTIYAEVDYRAFTSTTARRIVSLRVDATTLISLEASTSTGSIYVNIVSGASSVTANATGLTSGIYKIAVAYNNETNGTVIYVNGTLRDTKTAIVPDVRTATIGLGVRSDLGSTNQFNDRIRAVALYTSRLDDADLMVLTSPTYYSNVRDMIWDTFVARTSTFSEIPGCLQTRHNELITL
jgi:hypothetical protein